MSPVKPHYKIMVWMERATGEKVWRSIKHPAHDGPLLAGHTAVFSSGDVAMWFLERAYGAFGKARLRPTGKRVTIADVFSFNDTHKNGGK